MLYRLPVLLFSRRVLGFLVFLSTFFAGVFISALPAFAAGGIVNITQIESPVYDQIDTGLDVISIILMLIAIFYIFRSIRNYGKSTIGIAILYFLNATIVLGAIRLIFILGDDGIIPMQDITETTAWHILLVYSAIVFFFAGRSLTSLVNVKSAKSSYSTAMTFMIFSFILCLVVISSLYYVNDIFDKQLLYPWIESFGIYHIIGVFITAFIAIYLYQVKKHYKGFDRIIGSMHIALGLIAAICLWELFNETVFWKIIFVSDDFTEFTERVLWIPVFIFILYSFIKLKGLTASESTEPAVASNQQAESTPASQSSQGVIQKILELIPVLAIRKSYMKYS